jgi:hypothetical protein
MAQHTVSAPARRSPERSRRTRYAESSRFRRARAIRASLHEPARAPRVETDGPRLIAAPAESASVSKPDPVEVQSTGSEDLATRPGSESTAAAAKEIENHSADDAAPAQPVAEGDATEEASLTIPRGVMPPPMRGSLESLERQNEKLSAEGLERIEDEDDLATRIADGLLVPVPESAALTVNPNLPPNHRYCRPWTARFLRDLSAAHEALFHRPLDVSSAVRPETYQKRLMRTNGNAAPAEGDVVSPHMTGATIDIAKAGLTRAEIGWMRNRLLALQAEGKVDVEEEFRQACFHITVYKSYMPHSTGPTLPSHPEAQPQAADDLGAQGL